MDEQSTEVVEEQTLPQLHAGNQPDIYVKCPYFPEHELRKSRLAYHLIKCQKNPNAPKLLACPYNFLHRVKPEDKYDHSIICEDRLVVRHADRVSPSYENTRKQVAKNESPLAFKPNRLPQLPEQGEPPSDFSDY